MAERVLTREEARGLIRSNTEKLRLPFDFTTIGEGALAGFSQVKDLIIPEGVTKICAHAFFIRSFKGTSTLEKITIPTTLVTFERWAFFDCNAIKTIIVPETFPEQKILEVFFHVPNATVIFGKKLFTAKKKTVQQIMDETSGILSLGGASMLKVEQETLTIPNTYFAILPHAMRNLMSKGVHRLVIPASVRMISSFAFSFLKELEEIVLEDGTTHIDNYAFARCDRLRKITIPDSVTKIGAGAFMDCPALETVRLPRNLDVVSDEMFSGCKALKSVDFPETITRIGAGAFNGCSALEQMMLPDNVKTIGISAFWECTNLQQLYIPAGTQAISQSALGNCPALSVLYMPQILTDAFESKRVFGDQTNPTMYWVDETTEKPQFTSDIAATVSVAAPVGASVSVQELQNPVQSEQEPQVTSPEQAAKEAETLKKLEDTVTSMQIQIQNLLLQQALLQQNQAATPGTPIDEQQIRALNQNLTDIRSRLDAVSDISDSAEALAAVQQQAASIEVMQSRVERIAALQESVQEQVGAISRLQEQLSGLENLQQNFDALVHMEEQVAVMTELQEKLDAISGAQEKLASLSELQAKLHALSGLQTQAETLAQMQAKLDALSGIQEQQEAIAEIRSKLDALSAIQIEAQTLTDIQTKLDTLSGVQEQVAAIAELRKQLGALSGVQAQVDAISGLQKKLDSISGVQEKMKAISDIHAKMDALSEVQERLDAISDIQEKMDTLSGLQTQLDAISDIQEKVESLAAIQEQMAAISEIQEKVDAIADIQEQMAAHAEPRPSEDAISDIQEKISVIPEIQETVSVIPEMQEKINAIADGQETAAQSAETSDAITDIQKKISVIPDIQEKVSDIPEVKQNVEAIPEIQAKVNALTDTVEAVETTAVFMPENAFDMLSELSTASYGYGKGVALVPPYEGDYPIFDRVFTYEISKTYPGPKERSAALKDFTVIGYRSFREKEGGERFEIPEGVRRVESEAFWDCPRQLALELPLSLTEIEPDAFSGCSHLTDVYLADNFPERLAVEAFLFRPEIKLHWPKKKLLSKPRIVTVAELMENYDDILTSAKAHKLQVRSHIVQIPEGYTVIAPNAAMGIQVRADEPEHTLRTIFLPHSLRRIAPKAFFGMETAMHIVMRNGLRMIDTQAFSGCTGPARLILPDSVDYIASYAFMAPTRLEQIRLPKQLRSIHENAFAGCDTLTSLRIPKSVEHIGDAALAGCNALTSIALSRQFAPRLKAILDGPVKVVIRWLEDEETQNAETCSELFLQITEADYPPVAPQRLFTLEMSNACNNYAERLALMRSHPIIASGALTQMANQTKFEIPLGILRICSYAFGINNRMLTLTLPKALTKFEYGAFYGCERLRDVFLPDEFERDAAAVLFMSMPHILLSFGTARSVRVRQLVADNRYFLSANDAADLTIADGTVVVPDGYRIIASYMYHGIMGCTGLKRFVASSSLRMVGSRAFVQLPDLEEVVFAEGLTGVEPEAFVDCPNLRRVVFPSTLRFLGKFAFTECPFLESIVLPRQFEHRLNDVLRSCPYVKVEWLEPNTKADPESESTHAATLRGQMDDWFNALFADAPQGGSLDTEIVDPEELTPTAEDIAPMLEAEVVQSEEISLYETDNMRALADVLFGDSSMPEKPIIESKPVPDTTEDMADIADSIFAEMVTEQAEPEAEASPEPIPDTIEDMADIADSIFAESVSDEPEAEEESESAMPETTAELAKLESDAEMEEVEDDITAELDALDTIAPADTAEMQALAEALFASPEKPESLAELPADGRFTAKECRLRYHGEAAFTIPDGYREIRAGACAALEILETLTVSNTVERIGNGAFADCTMLRTVTIPLSVKEMEDDAFEGCESLEMVTLPRWFEPQAAEMFGEHVQLIWLEAAPKVIGDGRFTAKIRRQMYADETVLTIPEGYLEIRAGACAGLEGLTTLHLPETLTKICGGAFADCTSLTAVAIPASVTEIDEDAFEGCTALKAVMIPSHLAELAPTVFPYAEITCLN